MYKPSESKRLKWSNIEGKTFFIDEMTTSHISNTIRYIKEDRLNRANVSDKMISAYENYIKEFTMILRERNLNTLSIEIDETDVGINIEI